MAHAILDCLGPDVSLGAGRCLNLLGIFWPKWGRMTFTGFIMAFLLQKIQINHLPAYARARVGAVLLMAGLLAACSTEEALPQVEVDNPPVAAATRAGTLLAEYAS